MKIFNWEVCKCSPICKDAQQVNGEWYHPKWGCDSLSLEITEQREEMIMEIIEEFDKWVKEEWGNDIRNGQTDKFKTKLIKKLKWRD